MDEQDIAIMNIMKTYNKEKSFDLNLYFGLSLLLCYFFIFLNNENLTFNVYINVIGFKNVRNNFKLDYLNENLSFFFKLCEFNNVKNVKFKKNNNMIHPSHVLRLPLNKKVEIPKNFIPNIDISYSNFIVINTKVSQQGFEGNKLKLIWKNKLKKKLCDLLNSLNVNVILTGEREIEKCKEYTLLECFSIYNDLLNCINPDRIFDLTSKKTEDLYSYDKIINNFNIIKKSLFNVSIGFCGNTLIYSFLNDVVVFSYNDKEYEPFLKSAEKNYKNKWTDDCEIFLNTIKEYKHLKSIKE